jgi:carbon monoxide dehydrogenase subunit G
LRSQTFSHTASTATPVDRVWAALDRPETWAAIGGVDRVHDPVVDDEGRLMGFSFETRIGGIAYRGKASPRERMEGSVMAWDIDSPDIRGVTAVRLEGDGDAGTRLTVTLTVESKGMLASMFFPSIAGAVGRGLPGAVEEFAASLG